MLNITIDEFVNGFSVRGYDPKDGYFLNETHEERLRVLEALHTWLQAEILKEVESRRTAWGNV